MFITAQYVYCSETNILLKTTKTWNNIEFKSLNIKKPEVTVLHITIKRGEALPLHKHIMTNIAYIAKGKLTVTAENGQQKTVSKGECISELINTYHYGKNKGIFPVELIVFYIGEKDTPLAIQK